MTDLPADARERTRPGLEALEKSFRPLVEALPPLTDPAPVFAPEPEPGA